MYHILLYSSIFCSVLSLILCLYACARVGNFIKSTEGLDWASIANITGDLATLKKTIQTLNNRMNGMHSPKVQEQELMMQLLANQPKQHVNGKMKEIGLAMMASQTFPQLASLIIGIITLSVFVLELTGPQFVKLAIFRADEANRNITEEEMLDKYRIKKVMDKNPTILDIHEPLQKIFDKNLLGLFLPV